MPRPPEIPEPGPVRVPTVRRETELPPLFLRARVSRMFRCVRVRACSQEFRIHGRRRDTSIIARRDRAIREGMREMQDVQDHYLSSI